MSKRVRARELGITIGRLPTGKFNAITDVAGVRVGHSTIIRGEAGPLVIGEGPVRTGVTVILPREGDVAADPVTAGYHVLNGNGELTGLPWIDDIGTIMTPIAITNTHSVGTVRDALIAYNVKHGDNLAYHNVWSLPIVGETYDGMLSDINGFHVKESHVFEAVESASSGPVAEGCVGGGTGMICHGFKGGIGTSSRVVEEVHGGWTVGVLVQANYGRRVLLHVDGVPVGREIPHEEVPLGGLPKPGMEGAGSIIVVVATDAPLTPTQCRRLAQRATLGVARMGGNGENSSGDIFVAFSTGNHGLSETEMDREVKTMQFIPNGALSPLFEAAADATEEAILNAMCMATTTEGADHRIAYELPLDRLQEVMRKYNRLP